MASMTASANPVGIWGKGATGTTTITWDTESVARGKVYLTVTDGTTISVNNAVFDGDPVIGDRTGAKALTVKYGNTYILSLRQANNNVELAQLSITVHDLQADLTAEAAKFAAFDGKLQTIHDLEVTPYVDTCRVRFKTRQPTIPTIQAFFGSQLVASYMPSFGAIGTVHEALLGDGTPLPLEAELTLKIVATGHNALKQPIEVVSTSTFTTGSRNVTIEFTELQCDNDGDLLSKGDFTWSFYAGEVETGNFLADAGLDLPMSSMHAGDPPVAIHKTLSVPQAPRNLWVQVVAFDDDAIDGTPLDIATYTGEGSTFESTELYDRTQVTRNYHLGGLVNGSVLPVLLISGHFDVAFVARGRITVNTATGFAPRHFSFSDWEQGGRVTHVAEAGSMSNLHGKKFVFDIDPRLDTTVQGHVVAMGGDWTLFHQFVAPGQKWRPDQGWKRAAPPVEGPVTAVLMDDARIALFTVNRAGVVLQAEIGNCDRPGSWRSLGGRFIGSLAAVAREGSVELIAHDRDGGVFHRRVTLDGARGDWECIGGSVQSEPIAVALDDASFAVFALGRRGAVLMLLHRDGDWRSRDWQVIPGVTGISLGAAALEGQGIALAVLDRGMKLTTLAARDARGLTAKNWIAEGDLQAWLTRTLPQRGHVRELSRKVAAE